MKTQKEAFSLIVAILLTIVTVALWYIILEYMIPFTRNIRGVENSTNAYYLAYAWLEKGLYYVTTTRSWANNFEDKEIFFIGTQDSLWHTFNSNGNTNTFKASSVWYALDTVSVWSILPAKSTWNSDGDRDWSTINVGDPIQLSVWGNKTAMKNFAITFRVPGEKTIGIAAELAGASDNIINWQISSESETLSAIWSFITKTNINRLDKVTMRSKAWRTIDWTSQDFGSFYNDNCTTSVCILRFIVINPLTTNKNNIAPYLEWQVDVGDTNSIPLRYSIINSEGKAYWFGKTLSVGVPQETISEAFGFTVFQ